MKLKLKKKMKIVIPKFNQKVRKHPKLLLHPQIPKPLHNLSPRTIVGQEWWDKQRKEAYRKANYCCEACGVQVEKAKYYQRLEGHEVYKFNFKERTAKFIKVVALCFSCHNYIHAGRMGILVQKGKIPLYQMDDILYHGDKLTKNLKRPTMYTYNIEWCEWTLIFNDKEYKSKFKSLKEHEDYYGKT